MKPIITKDFNEQLDELKKQHIKAVLKSALKKVEATELALLFYQKMEALMLGIQSFKSEYSETH